MLEETETPATPAYWKPRRAFDDTLLAPDQETAPVILESLHKPAHHERPILL